MRVDICYQSLYVAKACPLRVRFLPRGTLPDYVSDMDRTTRLRSMVVAVVAFGFYVGVAAPAHAEMPPGGTFFDDDGSVHEGDVEAIAQAGITVGCDEAKEFFCPDAAVTRAEMATFLTRAFGLAPDPTSGFSDVSGVHAGSIGAVEAAGWVDGCNPPANDNFCPARTLTRGEAAKMLARALDLPAASTDSFVDDETSPFAADIERLAAAGITKGCAPDHFCPNSTVTRAQMASFLARALGLTAIVPANPFEGRMVLGLPSIVAYGGLAVMEDSRTPHTLIVDTVGQPVLSPDGSRIAYVDIRRQCPPDAQGPWDCYSRLFEMDFEGGAETQITPNTARPIGHDWTPAGDQVAFFDWADGAVVLSATNPDTGAIRRLSGPLSGEPAHLSWSRDDVLASMPLAFDPPDHAEITLMNPTGEIVGTIADPSRDLLHPEWSPDGNTLAFWAAGSDKTELIVANRDGTDRRVVATVADGRAVAWSPDGTRIAFLDFQQVWCIDIAGGEPWPLTPSSLPVNAIDWR